jgi:DNA polymerase-3 subunit epsilon
MVKNSHGYAVVETTGLRPDWNDRVIEVGIVQLDASGEITRRSSATRIAGR